jgi:hypothetical protein
MRPTPIHLVVFAADISVAPFPSVLWFLIGVMSSLRGKVSRCHEAMSWFGREECPSFSRLSLPPIARRRPWSAGRERTALIILTVGLFTFMGD